jgi:hypothetical protein
MSFKTIAIYVAIGVLVLVLSKQANDYIQKKFAKTEAE